MPHTRGRYNQDLGFSDGRVLASISDMVYTSSAGSITVTRIAVGDYALVAANSTTGIIAVNFTDLVLRRMGIAGAGELQEQFGTASGTAANPDLSYQGRPQEMLPTQGMSTGQQIKPRTANLLKGVKLNSFDVIYTVGSSNATTLTCRVDQIQYKQATALPTATSLLSSGANGLTVTASANSYVINVPLTAPSYIILADTVQWIEVSIVTPSGGTFSLRGIECNFEYNFN